MFHVEHIFSIFTQTKYIMKKFDSKVLLSKSVPSPSAHSTRLCQPGSKAEIEFATAVAKVHSLKNISIHVKAYILLLFTSGLRISELCNIHSSDIDSQLNIKIKGLKGSNDRIVAPIYLRGSFNVFRSSSSKIGDIFNRFYFYKLFKKIGLYTTYSSSVNRSVTHYPRYLYLKQLGSNVEDKDLIKSVVGHKRKTNTESYINKK